MLLVTTLLLVNPERFRTQIEAQLRARTGLPVTLQGPLAWRLWPLLAVDAGAGALQPAGATDAVVRWRDLTASAAPLDLLRGRWDLRGLAIDGLELHLVRAADGRGNWEALRPAAGSSGAAPSAWQAQLRDLQLTDASIEYQDLVQKQRYALHAFNLSTDIGLTAGGSQLRIDHLALGATLLAGGLRADGVPVALSVDDLQLDTVRQRAQVRHYDLGVASARVGGDVVPVAATAAAGWRLQGALQMNFAHLRQWLGELGIEAPKLRDAATLGPLTLQGQWQADDTAVSLTQLQLAFDDTRFTGEAGWQFAPRAQGRFALRGDRIRLDRYRSVADPAASPFELPTALLKSLPIGGTLELAQASFQGNVLNGVRVRFIDSGDQP